jgi:hypothetical protein
MTFHIEVNDQRIDVWTRDGRIDAVTMRQNTQTWTQGGGGYVSAQYGGWVQAPHVRTNVTEYKEVRILLEDGSRLTTNVDGNVSCVVGDEVSFVYAGPASATTGKLAGIVNHTERRWWNYRVDGLVEYRRFRQALAMIAAPLIVLLISNTTGKFVDWRISRIDSELVSVDKGLSDWDAYTLFNSRQTKPLSVKTFAAQQRPTMDTSSTGQQYFDRFNSLVTTRSELQSRGYVSWTYAIGFAAFLIAFINFGKKRHSVEQESASKLEREVRSIASRKNPASSPLRAVAAA